MIRVGIAGIGFMGMTHYLAYQKIDAGHLRAGIHCGWSVPPAGPRLNLSGESFVRTAGIMCE